MAALATPVVAGAQGGQPPAFRAVRTECSLFHLRHRVVACVLTRDTADTRWILDNEPNLTLAPMGAAIVAAWPR